MGDLQKKTNIRKAILAAVLVAGEKHPHVGGSWHVVWSHAAFASLKVPVPPSLVECNKSKANQANYCLTRAKL